MEYKPRIIDSDIAGELDVFGAVLIIGPKFCGKTTSATRIQKSIIRMQDEGDDNGALAVAKMNPNLILNGEYPRLIDEWQVAPQIWDAVRYRIDDEGHNGMFLLTGSVNVDTDQIMHSGAGRISILRMDTMSLFELGLSNGQVSLKGLFEGDVPSAFSDVSLESVQEQITRGGWPKQIGMSQQYAKRLIRGYCESIVNPMNWKKRFDTENMRQVLRSASRIVGYPLKISTIVADTGVAVNTANSYLEYLRDQYVLYELNSWNPNLRSRSAIRSGPVMHFCDPAIAAYFLQASSSDLLHDTSTFGLLFESLVIHDLRVYVRSTEGRILHYHDQDGLEADAIIHLNDGRWAAVEVKLGNAWVDEGAKNLIRLSKKIDQEKMGAPSFLAVVVPSGYAYVRDDGVMVIPITCLRD